jgi:Ceramidase
MKPVQGREWKIGLIAGLALLTIGFVFLAPRVTDPPSYFTFADRRTIIGIPNFMDVVSNAPWAIIGMLGLALTRRQSTSPGSPFTETWERRAFNLLFVAMALVAVGSARFHMAPALENLFWDRLPITIIFMCFLALMIGERIGLRVGRWLLVPLLAAGTASIFYWKYTGDLRWYLLVQLFPVVLVPLMFLLFLPGIRKRQRSLWA